MARKKVPAAKSTNGHPPATGGEFEEPLEVTLTDEEHEARSIRLAEVDRQIDEMTQERKDKSQQYGTKIKELKDEREPLINAVEQRKETRLVRCREVPDFERNNVKIIRLDTQEAVRERAMEGDERAQLAQGELVA